MDPISRQKKSQTSQSSIKKPEKQNEEKEVDIDIEEIKQQCQGLHQIGINIDPLIELLCTIDNKKEREEVLILFVVLLFLPRGIRLCDRNTHHNLKMLIRNIPILNSYFRDLSKFCFREREHDKRYITNSIKDSIPNIEGCEIQDLEEKLQRLHSLTRNSAASLINWQIIDRLIAEYQETSA